MGKKLEKKVQKYSNNEFNILKTDYLQYIFSDCF